MSIRFLKLRKQNGEDYSASIADMMTGLMVIFLFISVCFMIVTDSSKKVIDKMIVNYKNVKVQLYEELNREFKNNLVGWGAEIDKKDLTIRFNQPSVFFANGSSTLKPKFQQILNDFFPRYIKIIYQQKYRDHITEIRIEGHTSSVWATGVNKTTAYFLNMELSQDRTRETLKYILTNSLRNSNPPQLEWVKHLLTANGLSSSQLVYNKNGTQNQNRSRRVEFKIRTDADFQMEKVFEKIQSSE